MTEYTLDTIRPEDRTAVIDIFNHYIEHSFAAYPTEPVPDTMFDRLCSLADGYPSCVVRDGAGTAVGFGMLHAHNPMPAFARTAEVTYFIRADLTGQGLGSRILNHLETGAQEQGIACILASISSRNSGSIRFHAAHGFTECGRFRNVGEKNGTIFDTVWMEKEI